MKKVNALFKKACKKLGIDPNALPDYSMLSKAEAAAMLAHFKLLIIIRFKNDGWVPDWNNSSQAKYYPWLKVFASDKTPSGSGLSYDAYVYTRTDATVGSRLCFKTSDLAREAFEECKPLYEAYFLIKQ